MIRRYLSTEVAVLLSLILHALMFGSWQYRNALARWPVFSTLGRLMNSPARHAAATPAAPTITFVQRPEREAEPPRRFMETDDSQVTGEQPKDAKYYSDKATVAANPENPTDKTGDTPHLAGTETRMMSTETVSPRPGAGESPARPAPPTPPPAPPRAAPPEQPQPVAAQGLKMVEEKKMAALTPPPTPPPVAKPSYATGSSSKREIGAAKSKLSATGISRYGIAAFNVAESPFGAYDKGIILAVQTRWYRLIENNGLYERSGQVTLQFSLMPDGSVDKLTNTVNSAGEILGLFCEKAIVDSAPSFGPLPEKLRMLIGNQPREVNFTFYY